MSSCPINTSGSHLPFLSGTFLCPEVWGVGRGMCGSVHGFECVPEKGTGRAGACVVPQHPGQPAMGTVPESAHTTAEVTSCHGSQGASCRRCLGLRGTIWDNPLAWAWSEAVWNSVSLTVHLNPARGTTGPGPPANPSTQWGHQTLRWKMWAVTPSEPSPPSRDGQESPKSEKKCVCGRGGGEQAGEDRGQWTETGRDTHGEGERQRDT